VDLEASCPALPAAHRPRRPGAALPWIPGPATVAAWLRGALLCLLAALVLVALSVQAVDTDRIARSAEKYGPTGVANAKALQQMMAALGGKDDPAKLKAVNDFYNQRLAYREDIDNWGLVDYWASPLEALGKGAGDCEDYAIGKYFTLTSLGVPHARLRMVYVRASIAGAPNGFVAHMVLAYYPTPDAEPLVLDNLQPTIREAGERPDLSPVFSFNAEGLWQGVGSIRANGDPLTRLSKWREVLARARQDGFQ
jgi:predicted transglutaminase-like cysteine proteinase